RCLRGQRAQQRAGQRRPRDPRRAGGGEGSGRRALRTHRRALRRPAGEGVVRGVPETIDVPYVGRRERAVNGGVTRGGIAQPVVPQRCTVWLDVRYFVGETAPALMERIGAVCAQAVSNLPGVRVEASQERLDYEGNPYPRGSWGDFIPVAR